MTAAALGTAWAALLLAAAWRVRPFPARRLPAAPPPGARKPPALVTRHRRALVTVAAATVTAAVALPLAPLAGAAVWAAPAIRARRARRDRAEAVIGDLPDAVDLFLLAAGAGLTVPLAVEAVARRGHGPVAAALVDALAEVRLGRRLADALDGVPARLGEPVRPLVTALQASERYGAPLTDRLERLATEVRADRRRRAEEAARRVPVKLLFPLVLCVLPAFALLTVAPLIAGALSSLRP